MNEISADEAFLSNFFKGKTYIYTIQTKKLRCKEKCVKKMQMFLSFRERFMVHMSLQKTSFLQNLQYHCPFLDINSFHDLFYPTKNTELCIKL